MHSWDDIRIALAVAEAGSVSAAASKLGVSHTTILRRISAFEAETGAQLFTKGPRGYGVNHDRLKAFEAMGQAARAMNAAWDEIADAAVAPGAAMRLTSTDTLCSTVLPKVVASLSREQPDLRIALLAYNTHLNLSHGQADITVRPAKTLPDDLLGTRAGELGFAVYEPREGSEDWIGVAGPLTRSPVGQWIEDNAPDTRRRSDSFMVICEMVAAGLGRAMLPCVLGDSDPRVKRLTGAKPDLTTTIWVAGHREYADTGRLNRLKRQLVKAIAPHHGVLLGSR